MGASASAQRWLAAFVYSYNFQRPHRALDNRTPVEEVQNRRLNSAVGTEDTRFSQNSNLNNSSQRSY
jgi:putative transposase